MTIRSFRLAFDFERRLFRVDRWRLPFAYGIALRSIAYALAALACVIALARLPFAGAALQVLPAPFRFVVVPLAAAYALTRVDVDGRTAHRAAAAWVRQLLTPRRLCGFRRAPAPRRVRFGDVTFAPDEHADRFRRAVVEGPAVAIVRRPFRARSRGSTLLVTATSSRPLRSGKRVRLRHGQRLVAR